MSLDGPDGHPGYAVPTYRLDGDAWYHFLHGNVPGHEIDFIYRAEVPQPPLTRQHFSHLTRLLRYIEPQSHESFAFAIGNLSRDDTQHEPGHGGMALVFMLRIEGVTDHAGRQDPPFAHAIAAIDRELDEVTLIQTAVAFQKHILVQREAEDWYRIYARHAGGDPEVMRDMCQRYLESFADLPQAEPSALRVAWVTKGVEVPKRVVLVHDDDVSFGEIAVAAARVAAVLYRSDIRWTAISNGREDDISGGVSVRLVARSYLSPADAAGTVHELGDLPDEDAGIAHQLFKAVPLSATTEKQARGWRERFAASSDQRASTVAPEKPARRSWDAPPPRLGRTLDPDSVDVTLDLPAPSRPVPIRSEPPPDGGRAALVEIPPVLPFVPPPPAPLPSPIPAAIPEPVTAPALEPETAPRGSKRALWLILGGFCLVLVAIVVFVASHGDHPSNTPVSPSAASTVSAPPASVAAPPATVTTVAPTASVKVEPSATAAPASATPSAKAAPSTKPDDKKKGSKKQGTGRVIFDTP